MNLYMHNIMSNHFMDFVFSTPRKNANAFKVIVPFRRSVLQKSNKSEKCVRSAFTSIDSVVVIIYYFRLRRLHGCRTRKQHAINIFI